MIQVLRKESASGNIHDLAHVATTAMLSDCLTKQNIKPDVLVKAVNTGVLPNCDTHPNFRSLMPHKAYMAQWIVEYIAEAYMATAFLDVPIQLEITQYYMCLNN